MGRAFCVPADDEATLSIDHLARASWHLAEPRQRQILRTASTADLSFVLDLQKRFSNQLGFLPRQAIEQYLATGRVTIATDNGEATGYVLGRPSLRCAPGVQPIVQTAVHLDAQRQAAGRQLIEHVAAEARASGRRLLQAWCRVDLEANAFWSACGFTAIGIRRPNNARRQPLILWRRQICDDGRSELLRLPRQAGHHGRSSEPRRLLTTADRTLYAIPRPTAA